MVGGDWISFYMRNLCEISQLQALVASTSHSLNIEPGLHL